MTRETITLIKIMNGEITDQPFISEDELRQLEIDSKSIRAYKLFNLSGGATELDITKQYRKLSLRYHPDKIKGDKIKEGLFKLISSTYSDCKDYVQPQASTSAVAVDINYLKAAEKAHGGVWKDAIELIFRDRMEFSLFCGSIVGLKFTREHYDVLEFLKRQDDKYKNNQTLIKEIAELESVVVMRIPEFYNQGLRGDNLRMLQVVFPAQSKCITKNFFSLFLKLLPIFLSFAKNDLMKATQKVARFLSGLSTDDLNALSTIELTDTQKQCVLLLIDMGLSFFHALNIAQLLSNDSDFQKLCAPITVLVDWELRFKVFIEAAQSKSIIINSCEFEALNDTQQAVIIHLLKITNTSKKITCDFDFLSRMLNNVSISHRELLLSYFSQFGYDDLTTDNPKKLLAFCQFIWSNQNKMKPEHLIWAQQRITACIFLWIPPMSSSGYKKEKDIIRRAWKAAKEQQLGKKEYAKETPEAKTYRSIQQKMKNPEKSSDGYVSSISNILIVFMSEYPTSHFTSALKKYFGEFFTRPSLLSREILSEITNEENVARATISSENEIDIANLLANFVKHRQEIELDEKRRMEAEKHFARKKVLLVDEESIARAAISSENETNIMKQFADFVKHRQEIELDEKRRSAVKNFFSVKKASLGVQKSVPQETTSSKNKKNITRPFSAAASTSASPVSQGTYSQQQNTSLPNLAKIIREYEKRSRNWWSSSSDESKQAIIKLKEIQEALDKGKNFSVTRNYNDAIQQAICNVRYEGRLHNILMEEGVRKFSDPAVGIFFEKYQPKYGSYWSKKNLLTVTMQDLINHACGDHKSSGFNGKNTKNALIMYGVNAKQFEEDAQRPTSDNVKNIILSFKQPRSNESDSDASRTTLG